MTTSTVDGAQELVAQGSDAGARIAALAEATRHARGRLDDHLVADVRTVVDRAAGRLRLSADHTVVAVAGATGSGKSSTYNALTGLELSAVGVRRPTTSWASACVWGGDGAAELLAWLGIPPRHQTTRDSMLDSGRRTTQPELDGVVLLDLPDHDSTELAHHLEVERLVALADLVVWVLDPQKYADAAVHDRYLTPAREHQDVMLVVLNQIDAVPADRREAMVADVRRLLDGEGLGRVPVLAVSAREGIGIPELRAEIARRAARKEVMRARTVADVRAAAHRLADAGGDAPTRIVRADRSDRLRDAVAEAAGVPVVVDAVERATRARVGRATAWPVVSWLSAAGSTGGRDLPEVELGDEGRVLRGRGDLAGIPSPQVQRARVDGEARALADDVSAGLARPWAESVHRAATSRLDELGDRVDTALTATLTAVLARPGAGPGRLPWWAAAFRGVQWLLLLAAVAGLAWTGVLLGTGSLGGQGTLQVAGVALPVVLLVGSVVLGLVLTVLGRASASRLARRRAHEADARLRTVVADVVDELVGVPVEAELAAYTSLRSALARALA